MPTLMRTQMRKSDQYLYFGGCAIYGVTAGLFFVPSFGFKEILTVVLAFAGSAMLIASIIRDMRYMRYQNTQRSHQP